MPTDIIKDAESISIELNQLKLNFEEAIRSGDVFSKVKRIYLRIKELEFLLNTVNKMNDY